MQTIAEKIQQSIASKQLAAFTLEYGYGVGYDGARVSWPTGTVEKERRKESGRVTYSLVRYPDGSTITYRFSEATGFKIKAN